jgi:cytochrome c-type biogenesis protein CcmH
MQARDPMSLRTIQDTRYVRRDEERMSLFLTFGLMTLVAVLVVLLPLGRRRHGAAMSDVDVYRAQLAEVERAQGAGVLAAGEGLGLRTEVARRLIAAADRAVLVPVTGDIWRRRTVAVVAIAGLPLVALGIYSSTGNPQLPDQPRLARLAPSAPPQDSTAGLIARVEAVLKTNPQDGRGWDLLAPVYLRMGRAADAAIAYGNAIRLIGSTPEREAGRGEALTIAAGGTVTPQAREAFQRAVAADPANARARYFLARAKDQAGDRAGAVADYQALVDESPADAPWRAVVEEALGELKGTAP